MTLIATFAIHDIPFALGDLLISGGERPDVVPSIPAIGNITNVFPSGSGYSITGLRQKLHVLSSDCVIAWSGSAVHASVAIRELRELATKRPLTLRAIQEYIADNRSDIEDHIELVGWARDDGKLTSFSYPTLSESNTLPFEKIRLSGSGGARFQKLIQSLPPSPVRAVGAHFPLDRARTSAIYAASCMIQEELNTQDNLLEYFGGGWEIAFWRNNSFIKLDNVTFVFWEVQDSASGLILGFPAYVCKQDYLGDILRLHIARRTTGHLLAHECYFASPIDKRTSEDEKLHLKNQGVSDLNSPLLCHSIFYKSKEQNVSFTRIEAVGSPTQANTRFVHSATGLRVWINAGFTADVLKSIRRAQNGMPES